MTNQVLPFSHLLAVQTRFGCITMVSNLSMSLTGTTGSSHVEWIEFDAKSALAIQPVPLTLEIQVRDAIVYAFKMKCVHD